MRPVAFSLALGLAISASAQVNNASAPQPSFDVATIKPSQENGPPRTMIKPNRFFAISATVVDLIKYSYGVHAAQVIGGPEAPMHARYDITASVGGEKPNSGLFKAMVRSLLADRFQLTFHSEKRAIPVYLLTADTPHLKPSTQDYIVPTGGHSSGVLVANGCAMPDLAGFLQRYVTGRPIIHGTGIQGRYDMEIHYTPDDAAAQSAADATKQENPNLFTAIREQLGLKLTATKAQTGVMVIETVTAPTAN